MPSATVAVSRSEGSDENDTFRPDAGCGTTSESTGDAQTCCNDGQRTWGQGMAWLGRQPSAALGQEARVGSPMAHHKTARRLRRTQCAQCAPQSCRRPCFRPGRQVLRKDLGRTQKVITIPQRPQGCAACPQSVVLTTISRSAAMRHPSAARFRVGRELPELDASAALSPRPHSGWAPPAVRSGGRPQGCDSPCLPHQAGALEARGSPGGPAARFARSRQEREDRWPLDLTRSVWKAGGTSGGGTTSRPLSPGRSVTAVPSGRHFQWCYRLRM